MNNLFAESSTTKMPVLFLGHGSPMNAIAENSFTTTLNNLGKNLPTPKAILCVSAHWMTEGTWITEMEKPKTIHDFYGFPKALFDVQYPAPGNPELAKQIRGGIMDPKIQGDHEMWGLDHGTWSVLKHMYPKADIPVMQLSLNIAQPAEYHYHVGKTLQHLREKGILIVGSGNIVHNLRQIDWNEQAKPYDWAVEFDEVVKTQINKRDFKSLLTLQNSTIAGKLSVPTPDHYLPLLYILGAANDKDKVEYIYEGMQNASISMRCVAFS